MNKRQKSILFEIIIVITITVIAILVLLNVRGYVNRREAELAMTILGSRIRQYRIENGLVPAGYWVNRQRENLPGEVRLGELHYRGRWIDLESEPNEILAYAEHKSRSFFYEDGFFVLRLKEVLPRDTGADVNIEWMETEEFKAALVEQQSQVEIELMGD